MLKNFKALSGRYAILAAAIFLLLGIIPFHTKTSAAFLNASSKPTPTPKKKATPTPTKKSTAKATPTPKKNSSTATKDSKKKETTKSKTTSKTETKPSSSKSKTTTKKPESKSGTTSKTSKPAPTSKSSVTSTAKKPATRPRTSATPKKTTAAKTSAPKAASSTKSSAKTAAPKPSSSASTVTSNPTQVIITEVSARVREQAGTKSRELCRLPLGTVFVPKGKSAGWLRAECGNGANGKRGWISSNAARGFSHTNNLDIYKQIVEKKFSRTMDFATASELASFLKRVNPEIEKDSSFASMSLRQLLALRIALRAMQNENISQQSQTSFIKSFQDQLVFSEQDNSYNVKSSLFWALHEKVGASPLADEIAWEAARNPLPGKCEGYVNCNLFYVRMTSGEYLSLHPRGTNSAEALKHIADFLEPIVADLPGKSVFSGPTDVTDRAEFNNLIAELRTIVSRLPNAEKERTLAQLKQIAEAFR